MALNEIYQIIGIYRKICFEEYYVIICCKNDEQCEFRCAEEMKNKIISGYFCEGDFIKITKERSERVEFEQTDKNVKNSSKKLKSIKIENELLDRMIANNRLPYLNNTLPNSTREVKTVEMEPVMLNNIFQGKFRLSKGCIDEVMANNVFKKSSGKNCEITSLQPAINKHFLAKIQQKTRINCVNNKYNPFFFVIASSNGVFIKIVFWKENLDQFSSLKVNDIIYVHEMRKKIKMAHPNMLIYNNFTESAYFSCEEVTAISVYKVESEIFSKNTKIIHLFETIRGKIIYSSIVFRRILNEGIYEEFKYLKIRKSDGAVVGVILANNSQQEFYDIQNDIVELLEMRKIERGTVEFYYSTIYTQIAIIEDLNQKYSKNKVIYDPTTNEIVKKTFEDVYEEGGIAFLPDNYKEVEDVAQEGVEILSGKEKIVEPLWTSAKTTLDEIMNIYSETEVLDKKYILAFNEIKKFWFKAKITKLERSDLQFDHLKSVDKKDFTVEKQKAYKIILDEIYFVYFINNMFITAGNELISKIERNKDKECIIFVDALRVGHKDVLIYITGLIE